MTRGVFARSKRVIFFDLNGTLLDREASFKQAFQRTWDDVVGRWADENKPTGKALWERYASHWQRYRANQKKRTTDLDSRRRACLDETLRSYEIEWKDPMLRSFFGRVKEEQVHTPVLRSGALETVADLSKRYTLGIISNVAKPQQVAILAATGLKPYFREEHLISAKSAGLRKPNPAVYRRALTKLNIRPDQAVMVGNSYSADCLGAIRASMDAVWIHPRHNKKCSRRKVGSSHIYIIRRFGQLRELFRQD